MIKKWKIALKDFLKDYEEDDNIIGAILCGSYALDNHHNNSDIDVYLVLSDTADYSEMGVVESNSYLIEYYKHTVDIIKEKMEKEHENNELNVANMFAYGKVIYDVEGKVEELQKLALEYIDKPFKTITKEQLDKNNYLIWTCLNNLKKSIDQDAFQFNMNYYELLHNVYDVYAEYLGISKLSKTKIYKLLTDFEYREKYHVFNIPEDEFVNLYLKCFDMENPEKMYRSIKRTVDYYYNKIGGFNIREFKIRASF